MIVSFRPPSPVQRGDLLLRPKDSGFGCHYGTGVTGGCVAHTLPGRGKHVGTLGEFGNNKPIMIVRVPRTALQKLCVEQRALSDLGKPYFAGNANCEHDANYAQTGVAFSPTVNSVGAAVLIGGLFGILKITSRLE